MKILKLRGFSRDNYGRALKRMARRGAENVWVQEHMKAPCVMRFDNVFLAFDGSTHRPYLKFSEGRVKELTIDLSGFPDVDADEARITLAPESRPETAIRWDLSNDEIAGLVKKGLFGFDYDYDHEDGQVPRPVYRGPIRIPSDFTANDMDLSIECDVVVMCTHDKEGRAVPIIGAFPKNPMGLRTNSRIEDYGDLSEFFDEPHFAEDLGAEAEEDSIFLSFEDEDVLGFGEAEEKQEKNADQVFGARRAAAEKPAEKKPEKPDYLMTPEEKALSALSAKVRERTEAAEAERRMESELEKAEEKASEKAEEAERPVPEPEPVQEDAEERREDLIPEGPADDSEFMSRHDDEDEDEDDFLAGVIQQAEEMEKEEEQDDTGYDL